MGSRGILVDLIRSAPTLSGVELKDVGSNTTIYLFGSPSEVATAVSSLSKACPLANNCLVKNHIPAPLIESENGFVFLKKGSGFIAYRVEGRILPFKDLSSLPPSVNTTAFGCVGDTLRSTSSLASSLPESPSKEESSTSPAILEALAIFFLIVMVILYLMVGGLLVC